MLTLGVLLFGVSPGHDAPIAPPSSGQHGVNPNHEPSHPGLAPDQRCTDALATASVCGHQRTTHAHSGGHDARQRLSPKELSLAKW